MTTGILHYWDGKPRELGDLFVLTKDGRTARGHVVTNPLGWECRLVVGPGLVMSQVCRTREDVLVTSEAWKSAMKEKGWANRV